MSDAGTSADKKMEEEESLKKLEKEDGKPRNVVTCTPLAKKIPGNKQPVSSRDEVVDIETNMRRIELTKNIPIYKYVVKITTVFSKGNDTVGALISNSKKKGAQNDRDKDWCRRVYRAAINELPQLQQGTFFYDGQAALYSLNNIENGACTIERNLMQRSSFLYAQFELERVSDSFQTSTNEIQRTHNLNPASIDRTLLEALNILTSGRAYGGQHVYTMGSCIHYWLQFNSTDNMEVAAGIRKSHFGAYKSVRTLEGPTTPALYLTTEMKHSLFHPTGESLLDLFRTFIRITIDRPVPDQVAKKMLKAVKGLQVYCRYGPGANDNVANGIEGHIVKISGFGPKPDDVSFDWNDRNVTVTKYFEERYHLNLRYKKLFTIIAKGRDGLAHYPVELLHVYPHQIVRNEQMGADEQANLITLSAVEPSIRKAKTEELCHEIGFDFDHGDFMRVEPPTTVKAVVLPKPRIVFAKNQQFNWAGNKNKNKETDFPPGASGFHSPKTLVNWEVVYRKEDKEEDAVNALIAEMRQRGMTVHEPYQTVFNDLRKVFENAKRNKRKFLLFISSDLDTLHQQIKCLELEFDILTMNLKLKTAQKLMKMTDTRKNVAAKVNIKLGGVNFDIVHPELDPAMKRLIIGLETSTRTSCSDTVSIGYAANILENYKQFAGGYKYVAKSGDVFKAVIKPIVKRCVEEAVRLKRPPLELIMYINGVSEGQFSVINDEYVAEIKDAYMDVANKRKLSGKPHITVIAVSKIHNTRLYLKPGFKLGEGSSGVVNIKPGTVVDHTIVSADLTEWYHTGSIARKGTAKPVKYTVIFTTKTQQTIRSLEELTNVLCYDHQIIHQTTSLPAPVLIAGRYSERGSMILAKLTPVLGEDNKVDVEATNERCGSESKGISSTRYNA